VSSEFARDPPACVAWALRRFPWSGRPRILLVSRRSLDGWAGRSSGASAVPRCRGGGSSLAGPVAGRGHSCGYQEIVGGGDFAVEVAWVHGDAPSRPGRPSPGSSPTVNSGAQKPVASGVYSSFARARSRPSARISAWSKASRVFPSVTRDTGVHRASAASNPATGLGRSGHETCGPSSALPEISTRPRRRPRDLPSDFVDCAWPSCRHALLGSAIGRAGHRVSGQARAVRSASRRGVVGRPIRRRRVPLVSASSPRPVSPSRVTRNCAVASSSPAERRLSRCSSGVTGW
jgi:hypothetical protein